LPRPLSDDQAAPLHEHGSAAVDDNDSPVVSFVFGLEDAKQAADYLRRLQAVGKGVVPMP